MNQACDDLNVRIVRFEEKAPKNGWSFKPTIAKECVLTYVTKGCVHYTVEDVQHVLTSGDAIFITAGEKKEGMIPPNTPTKGYSVFFHYDLPGGSLTLPPRFHIGIDSYLISLFKELNRVWLEKRTGWTLRGRALFLLILHHLIQCTQTGEKKMRDSRIEDTIKYILSHPREPMDVSSLAAKANLSPDYFGSCFKKHTGYSLKEYINRIRIHKAQDLLRSGDYNVSETAYACGYRDIFYFSKTFKSITGQTPLNYMNCED